MALPPPAPPPPLPPTAPQGVGLDFAALYEAHARAIYYLALRLLGDSGRAEDAVHDVFLKAYRAQAGFRHAAEVRTWLYRIALNHCQNLLGSWQQRNIHPTATDELLERAGSGGESPLRACETRELGERIRQALDEIAPAYRILLLLVADEELGYDAIASLTSQTPDAVRGKLHRARKAFAAAFARTA